MVLLPELPNHCYSVTQNVHLRQNIYTELFIHSLHSAWHYWCFSLCDEGSLRDARYWCFYLFCLPCSAVSSPVSIIVHVAIIVIKKGRQFSSTFGSLLKKKSLSKCLLQLLPALTNNKTAYIQDHRKHFNYYQV